ncbi:MAG: toll/interleukin-1 receptor domain-containing protein [Chloroflexota bacterium]|nr:toll/interleukin-1 receptor domain-containing protein [Chloroflexota bacterium]
MADKEHLAILKKGVRAWNEWRNRKSKVVPDLAGAALAGTNLSSANLSSANLMGADLGIANLSGANLLGAMLERANLFRADLTNADLSLSRLMWAYLSRANLRSANLMGADLSEANLRSANLMRADLSEANLNGAYLRGSLFSGAHVGSTIFANVNLNYVNDLAEAVHLAPSSVGIDTVYRSNRMIPEVFLRGCGVPDEIIAIAVSLRGKTVQFYSCFISYSSKDEAFAKRVHADLQSKGVRVWFAPEDLKIGDKFRSRIDEAIRIYDKLLIVLSEHSINSAWVEKDVEAAFEKEQKEKRTVLFPVRLDDAVMKTDQAWAADIRRTRHIGDMSAWKDHDRYQAAFERLLRDLQAGEVK